MGTHYNFSSPDIFRDVAEIIVISYALSMLIGAVFLKIRNANVQQKNHNNRMRPDAGKAGAADAGRYVFSLPEYSSRKAKQL